MFEGMLVKEKGYSEGINEGRRRFVLKNKWYDELDIGEGI
jgi:hypothetical protein